VHVGTVDLPTRVDREKYFRELRYLELSALFAGPLKPSALASWAAVAPADALGLVAPFPLTHRRPPKGNKLWKHDASTGEFRDSTLAREAFAAVNEAAAALHARCIVFRSPESFSPSAANRERLQQFFSEVAPAGVVERVWVPGGLWELRAAVKLATELGVTCAIDPLSRAPGDPIEATFDLEAASLYIRVERAGALGPARLDDLADVIEHYGDRRLAIALATPNRWQDARALQKLLNDR